MGSSSGTGSAAGERDSATGELVPGTETETAPRFYWCHNFKIWNTRAEEDA